MTQHDPFVQGFNRARLERLRAAYDAALLDKLEAFNFEGHVLLTAYAKYVIEYLEGALR